MYIKVDYSEKSALSLIVFVSSQVAVVSITRFIWIDALSSRTSGVKKKGNTWKQQPKIYSRL